MSHIKRFILMITLTLMWSPSFLFIKLALHDLPPLTIVALRVSLAAAVLLLILMWKRTAIPKDWVFWVQVSVMAWFASVLPFCMFCYAEQTIDSSLAAVINGSTPMFTAVLAQLFVASDRMNAKKCLGVVLSCGGLVLLFAPQLLEGVNGTTLGMAAALIASFSYSVSHIFGKLYITGLKPFVAPATQFIASSFMVWPLAIYHDQVWDLSMPSGMAMFGVCGLAFFGTVVAFIIYFKLLDHCGPTAVSTVACFFPVVGMILGFLFLGETFTLMSLFASFVIFAGMLYVNEVIEIPFYSTVENHEQS
jgi:drug/metabolite transporter (DMT)-like permease